MKSYKTMTASQVLNFGLTHNLEIVSYGLAPNPWGFCFEVHPSDTGKEASAKVQKEFSAMLESLTIKETNNLKGMVF